MSYPQFGYPYSSAPQFLMTTNSLTSCCESGGRGLAEAGVGASAQTPVYCPVYESRLLATARHELTSAAALGVYGSAYPAAQGYGNYVTYGTDPPAFYSLNAFESKDGSGSTHAGITQAAAAAAAYYPYDHTLSQYPYDRYGSMDGGTRRKNATRETTSTLKAWLQEHRKNPYPTKGEKIMLAIITKMTLTQVSTWFANARRRLKKENKVTWAPRNKSEDEDEEDGDGDRAKEESSDKVQESNEASAEDEGISLHVDSMTDHSCSAESDGEKLPCLEVEHLCESGSESKDKYEEDDEDDDVEVEEDQDLPSTKHFPPSPLRGMDSVLLNHHQQQREEIARTLNKTALDNAVSPSSQPQAVKPKLWSLAEIATSDHKQQTLGQSCQSTALCPPPTSTNSHGSTYSPSSILGGLIYYTSPFYSNYANYGNFNAALQSQGILRYGSAAMAAGESLGQTVITTGSAHKQAPDSLRTASSQSEQHFRGSSYEPKKGEPVL